MNKEFDLITCVLIINPYTLVFKYFNIYVS